MAQFRVIATAVLCTAAGAVVQVSHQSELADKVRLKILYESMCPYCEQLLANSFTTVWNDKEFRERIELELHPFGNAMVVSEEKISKGYHFFHPDAIYPVVVCQHKEAECLGNALQACALAKYDQKEVGVPFVMCMARQSGQGHGIEMAAYDCMEELKMDKDAVTSCANSQEGRAMIVQHGEATRATPNVSYVPWVTTNDVQVVFGDDHDLVTPLCSMLAPPRPLLCDAKPVKASSPAPTNLMAVSGEVSQGVRQRVKACYREDEAEGGASLLELGWAENLGDTTGLSRAEIQHRRHLAEAAAHPKPLFKVDPVKGQKMRKQIFYDLSLAGKNASDDGPKDAQELYELSRPHARAHLSMR